MVISKPPPPRGGTIDSILLALSGQTSHKTPLVSASAPKPIRKSDLNAVIKKGKGPLRGESSKVALSVRHTRETMGKSQAPGNQRRHGGSSLPPPTLATESRSWAQLFPLNEKNRINKDLSYIAPSLEDGEPVVPSEDSDLVEMEDHWRLSLIGYVIGKKPYFKAFIDYLYRVWKPKGNIEVLMQGGGFFVVRFSSEEDLQCVIEGGPWFMGGRPIVLRKWHRGIKMELERLETIPIWIRFPQLPLHLWGKRMLSKLASIVGTPIYTDSSTANCSRIEYAHICVEISALSSLPEVIRLKEDGIIKELKLEYEWKPSSCKACNTFGHSEAQCPLSSSKPSHSISETVSVKVSSNSAPDKREQSSKWVPVKHAGTKASTTTKASDIIVQDNSFKALSEVIEEEHQPAQLVQNNSLSKVTEEEPVPEVTHQGKPIVVAECSEVTNAVFQPIILNPAIVSTTQAEESHSDLQREQQTIVESLTPLTVNSQVMQQEFIIDLLDDPPIGQGSEPHEKKSQAGASVLSHKIVPPKSNAAKLNKDGNGTKDIPPPKKKKRGKNHNPPDSDSHSSDHLEVLPQVLRGKRLLIVNIPVSREVKHSTFIQIAYDELHILEH
ncbi:hypothetical protein QJS10_CPA01g02066 [Acorus calamus]|uniref:DUF4283 domain-containing protein n=1 Tax=Acorus calamus TaxID=4465 RepID=A0AAV9FJR2_ACOCL|nr:hypothetical protein QJS10_CPA01g02066 [Acorus calamus]